VKNPLIGKKIMAGEPVYRFSTGECIGRTRRRNIGIIENITGSLVTIFNAKNPKGYQRYEIQRKDFERWCSQGLYVLK